MKKPLSCLLGCVRRWRPLTELILTAAMVYIGYFAAGIAYRSDVTFHREADLLSITAETLSQSKDTLSKAADMLSKATEMMSKATDIVERERVDHARDAFDKALDEADGLCSECQECAPPFGILIPLDKAAGRVAELKDVLTAAEYNRLAILGSSAWDLDKARAFALEALKPRNSHSPIDESMSNLVLGHLDFIAHRADKDPKTLEKARGYFRNSIKALYDLPGTDAVRFYLGQAEALWAKHELAAHAGDDGRKDFYEHYGLAKQRWEGLPKGNTFIAQLRAEIALGQPDHIPNIACMFSLASPKSPCDGRRGGCAPCAPLQLVTLRLFNAAIAQGVTEDKIVQMAREKEIATSEKEGLTLYHLYFDSATAPTFAPVPVASVPKPQPAVPSFRTPPSTFKSSTLAPVPQQPHRASRPHA